MANPANSIIDRFYIHAVQAVGVNDLPIGEGQCAISRKYPITLPACLLWLPHDNDGSAMLAIIDKCDSSMKTGMVLRISNAVKVRLSGSGVMNTLSLSTDNGYAGRDRRDILSYYCDFHEVADDRSNILKAILFRSNTGVIDDSYFEIPLKTPQLVWKVQAEDAWRSAHHLFNLPDKSIPAFDTDLIALREHEVLESDMENILSNKANSLGIRIGSHDGKSLWLYRADRTPIEDILGVDLVYRYIQENRFVFVQYKCVNRKSRTFYAKKNDGQLARMQAIPGALNCPNLSVDHSSRRLCGCPVYLKLCDRFIHKGKKSPKGVYFPVCIWKAMVDSGGAISLKSQPHLISSEFHRLAKTGMIGTTPSANIELLELVRQHEGKRLQLLFTENPDPQ